MLPAWRLLIRRGLAAKPPRDFRFSRSPAYYGDDKLKVTQPAYVPGKYDTSDFVRKRFYLAFFSIAIFFAYFGYLREPNDIDLILNSQPHVLAGNLERQVLRKQIEEAKKAGKSTELLEAQLAYVDVKEATVKASFSKQKL